jgi:hypothetical protein
MKILFVTHHYPNYVPDLLLHGLRKLFGPSVVDYPRKECLYHGVLGLGVCPDDQLCPGWFPDDQGKVDRDDIPAKLATGFFDVVVCDVRSFPALTALIKAIPKRLAVIDGEDKPYPIKPGPYIIFRRETDGSDFSIPLPMALPEEIFNWITNYDDAPKLYSIGFLGSTQDGQRKKIVEALASRYSSTLFQATSIPSSINPKPDGRLGRDIYYRSLQSCKVVLTLAGHGFDTFRFWENAACNSIHASVRFPLFIPSDFADDQEIIRFTRIEELLENIDRILSQEDRHRNIIRDSRYKLAKSHFTIHRAAYFVNQVFKAYV